MFERCIHIIYTQINGRIIGQKYNGHVILKNVVTYLTENWSAQSFFVIINWKRRWFQYITFSKIHTNHCWNKRKCTYILKVAQNLTYTTKFHGNYTPWIHKYIEKVHVPCKELPAVNRANYDKNLQVGQQLTSTR